MAPSPAELSALSRKYRLLGELRRRVAAEPPPELALVAREFPGSLRELDALPLEELDRRAASAEAALSGGAGEALLEWVGGYHSLMRAVLAAKRALSGRRSLAPAEARALSLSIAGESGTEFSVELLAAVANPPRGRLNELVFGLLSTRFGVPPAELEAALFGSRPAP